MKASELIKDLASHIAHYGDEEVVFETRDDEQRGVRGVVYEANINIETKGLYLGKFVIEPK